MLIDSKEQELNLAQVIIAFLDNEYPPEEHKKLIPLILAEFNHENVQLKQIGNTVFEVIKGEGPNAYFKPFNADTEENFVNNMAQFFVYAHRVMGLNGLTTDSDDQSILHVFNVIASNPPLPNMKFQVFNHENNAIQIDVNLGE